MYKVIHWVKSLIGDVGYAEIENYFTNSKNAVDYYFDVLRLHKNCALVVSSKNVEFVFMAHYDGNFPDMLKEY